jgi:sarcosine oxidase subunit alpha
MQAGTRKQLVGLRTRNPQLVLEEGAQVAAARRVAAAAAGEAPMPLIGHVTSSYFSAALGHSIALALVAGGRARLGQTLFVPMPGADLEVEVTSPVFYDKGGARING